MAADGTKCMSKVEESMTPRDYRQPCTLAGGGNQEIKVAVMDENKKRRIRKLTPLECWRLMGFDDEDFRKAEAVNSNSQLYKQAGNSIVVNVLEGILRNLLLPADPHKQEAQDILKWLDEVMEVRD